MIVLDDLIRALIGLILWRNDHGTVIGGRDAVRHCSVRTLRNHNRVQRVRSF
jgi:hypothetical protein